MLSRRRAVIRAFVIVASTAAFAHAEESFRLKLQTIRYVGPSAQNLTQDAVLSSLELVVWPSRPFQVQSTHQGDSAQAKGELNTDDNGSFILDIEYEINRSSGRTQAQTRIGLKLDEGLEIGSLTTSTQRDGKQAVSKEAFHILVEKLGTTTAGAIRSRAGGTRTVVRLPARKPSLRDRSDIDQGIMIDHSRRIEKFLSDEKNLPTTFETNRFDRADPIFEIFRVPQRN